MGKNINQVMDEFKSPSSIYRGAPFWAWNGKLKPDELRRQIRIMHEMGLGGFFMHSRVGLDTAYLSEEWFECINACADEAKKLHMFAYLYDEDRWPSGAAGGLVTKNPKYRMRYLCLKVFKDYKKVKWNQNVIAVFIAEFEGNIIRHYKRIKKGEKIKAMFGSSKILVFTVETQKPSDWYNGYTYLDTMNPEAVKEFIKTTHSKYKKYSGRYFGKVIPGIFTDEPNYGSQFFHYAWPPEPEGNILISWTDKLPVIFKKRYSYDILDYLPEIYFDVKGKEISKPRYHYRDCTTHLFVDSFAKQIGDWCGKNKILFTGHVLSEDTLRAQTNVVGNCMRFYQYMQAPGMDLLTEHWRIFNTAKQVSSVARQFGRKWRLTETYGCTGWDFPFSGHKALGDWQTALGINLRCQHLSWYTMLAEAKRDYPASIFYQSPWWHTYKKVEDYFARIYSIMTEGSEVRDLLVIHPIESMWTIFKMPEWNYEKNTWERCEKLEKYDEMFTLLCDNLLSSHIDFDYGDEEIMSRWAKIKKNNGNAVLKINKAEYKAILVPPLYTMRSSTLKILKKFRDAGGKIIFVEKFPEYIDAEIKQNTTDAFEIAPDIEKAIDRIEPVTRRISITDNDGNEIKQILYLLREDKDVYYLFLCNTSMEWNKDVLGRHTLSRERNIEFNDVTISSVAMEWKYPVFELDPETGDVYPADTMKIENNYAIKTSFPPLKSHLYIIPKNNIAIQAQTKEKLQEIEKINLEKEMWDVQFSEKNALVLDMPYFRIKNSQWQEKKEILKLDREIRKQLRIPVRGGTMVQPWARRKERRLNGTLVTLRYVFDVEDIPSSEILLAIEKPDLYRISINGYSISSDMECGWWVDKSLRVLKFEPYLLTRGQNEIILETIYNEDHPGLEIIYLLGDFGVKIANNQPKIIEKIEKLKIGDWTQQGLPFYSGNITYLYEMQVEIKEKQKIFVRIPDYRGTAVRILVNGKQAGIIAWKPNEVDITDFIRSGNKCLLGIEILGHRRNSHGPLHFHQKWPIWTGPSSFVPEGEEFTEDYQIVPCGLMKTPEVIRYSVE